MTKEYSVDEIMALLNVKNLIKELSTELNTDQKGMLVKALEEGRKSNYAYLCILVNKYCPCTYTYNRFAWGMIRLMNPNAKDKEAYLSLESCLNRAIDHIPNRETMMKIRERIIDLIIDGL